MKNFIALLLFAGGFAGWYLYNKHEKVKSALAEAQINLKILEDDVVRKRGESQTLTSVAQLRKQVQERQGQLAALQAKQRVLDEARKKVMLERAQILTTIRKSFIGKEFAELALANGRKLEKAKIMKLEGNEITFSTATGVTKIAPTELPADLRQQMRY